MAAEKMTNLPSGSVDAIPKDAAADEFSKAMKGNTTGGFPSPFPSVRTPMVLERVFDVLDNGGCRKFVNGENLKIEKDGSVSINFKLPDGGAPGIFPAWRYYDPEIENQKVIRFLNASMSTEFPGGDNKVMVVKVANLPPEIEKKDVAIAVENRKLFMELNTVLEEYGKIKKVAELPDGVIVNGISTLMEDRILTVTVALEKPEPEEKAKSIISKIKGALAKAWPACLAIGGKMAFDAFSNGDAN